MIRTIIINITITLTVSIYLV